MSNGHAPPSWLPGETAAVSGSWETIRDGLYAIYQREIKGRLTFRGLPVELARYPIEQGCEEGFWHLTSKNEWIFDAAIRRRRQERVFDERRCRKLAWLAPLLANADDPVVKTFEFEEDNGDVRTYIWLQAFDYLAVVVPSRSRNPRTRDDPCWYLVTAFSIDYPKKRAELAQKYRKRKS
jgi:hypothetical protein